MAFAQKMAIIFQINNKEKRGAWLRKAVGLAGGALLLLVMYSGSAYAVAPDPPTQIGSAWKTGGFNVGYQNVTVGALVKVYFRYDWEISNMSWTVISSFTAPASSGTFVQNGLPNGTTYSWRITQTIDGEESEPSNEFSGTPPYTVFVINWPEMLADIQNTFNNSDQTIINTLNSLFTPSSTAITNLQDSITNIKNAIGIGQVETIGTDIITGIDDIKDELNPPLPVEGSNPYGGGIAPNTLPPLIGTMNDLSWCVDITHKWNGDPFQICLFTDEQLEKLGWWSIVRNLLNSAIYITFVVWVVSRFTPAFKV
ncbi:MAG TPA: hypothetical protein VGE40_03365 [Bacilli bacterium]